MYETPFYLDIFCTAIEGGINYWASVNEYHWSFPGGGGDRLGFYADIVDEVHTGSIDTDTPVEYRIDLSTIRKGLELARTGDGSPKWSIDGPPSVVPRDTDWDFDAGDADMIVQLGLFGEVIYG
jgi:hypothetical protein